MYDSMLDNRETVSGTFEVARFRYVYPTALDSAGHLVPKHDESIHTLLLDCEQAFSGTLATTYKLRGEVVRIDETPDDRLLMMQSSTAGTVMDLCAFLKTPR